MKILSLIVPAYNSAHFLERGIGSFLLEEVLDKLDIIIVNDGSMDATAAAAEVYCARYPESIRLISQENKGHGGALNTGCAAARGKYLKVIDADDWINTQSLPEFIHLLEACSSDVVLTHYHTVDISTGEIKNWRCYPEAFGKPYTFSEIMGNWKSFDRCLTFHGITYRTDFYHKHGYTLSEHVFYEDHEFATFPCCMAESITAFDLFVYEYRIGDVQQSVSDVNQCKRIGHTETVLRRMGEEYHKLDLSQDAPGRVYVCMKVQGLLLSYLTTVMLVQPDKKYGRKQGAEMMAFFRQKLPGAYERAVKQYRIFCLMNLLGISKKTFHAILRSKIYNKLRGKHDFE